MQEIDITPSTPWQDITTTVDEGDGVSNTYIFEIKWNVRDSSWYLSLYEQDRTVIFTSKRLVLGMYVGRRSRHPLLRKGVLVVVDTSRKGAEATLDTLGAKCVLRYYTAQDVIVGRNLNAVNTKA